MKAILAGVAICIGLLVWFERNARKQIETENRALELERRDETFRRIEDNTPDPNRTDGAVLERLCRQAGLEPDCADGAD